MGQQNIFGQRVIPTLNGGKRTLPHYAFENLSLAQQYESRGFIDTSFINGLNPKQYYFHNMSGRESTCDTAMNTATSGYIQRRIIKLIEDIKIQYDGTVRGNIYLFIHSFLTKFCNFLFIITKFIDVIGSIYQLSYGDDGFDPKTLIKVGKNLEFCDVTDIVNSLNMEFEKKIKNKVIRKIKTHNQEYIYI